MFKKSYFKGFVSGILVVLLTTNIVFAATSYKSIKVTFDNIKMVFDGIEKNPAAGSKPITYNGKIYVPLDFAAKSMGKKYTWDSKNKKAYIGLTKNEILNGIVAKTSDGYAQLTFPNGWKGSAPTEQTTLNYSNGQSGFLVIRENKSILSSDATIDDYCSLVTEGMLERLENPITTEPSTIKINSYPALQFELEGEIQKLKLKYLCTVMEINDSYYQLIAFSSQDDYDKYKSSYLKIIKSFKEISK